VLQTIYSKSEIEGVELKPEEMPNDSEDSYGSDASSDEERMADR